MSQKIKDSLHSPFAANFLAGGAAGCVSRTVVSPLERMKIIFQIQTTTQTNYKGVWPTLVKMWKEEGWRGYMRGNGSNCLRIFPYSAIQFASYNLYKPFLLKGGEKDLDTPRRLTAGALAGITSVALTYPLDITRTRLSIQFADIANLQTAGLGGSLKMPGMWSTMKLIYKNEGGILGLYRGIMPTIYGVAPYVGLNFAVYESVRKRFVQRHNGGDPNAIEKLASGAISGAVAQCKSFVSCYYKSIYGRFLLMAQVVTYPFDVLRRRFQVNTMLGDPYRNVWHACQSIAAKEGAKGFYKGLWPNLLKVVPSMSSSWLTFEVARSFLLGL